MSWPVLVEQLSKEQATAIYCESCDWTGHQADPGDGEVSDVLVCPVCKTYTLDYCYQPALACSNCGCLDFGQPLADDHGAYCSRRCQLQCEYARTLPERI